MSVAAAIDRDVTIVRDRLIERCNFFYCRARVESRARNRFARGVHARDKKQIIHDSGEPFAFSDGGLNGLAILGSGAIACESDLRFAQHIGNGRSQFVSEIGGELREPRKRIVKPVEHLVERDGKRSKLAWPTGRSEAFLQVSGPDPSNCLCHSSHGS